VISDEEKRRKTIFDLLMNDCKEKKKGEREIQTTYV
jgi:hypothetical protein